MTFFLRASLVGLCLLAAVPLLHAQDYAPVVPPPPYHPPCVAPAPVPVPVAVTTYRYGLLGRRSVTTVTYGAPVPVVAPAPVVVSSYYPPPPVVVRPRRVLRFYPPVIYYP
jgi:hypothetical protein